MRIAGVRAGDEPQHVGGIRDGPREQTDMVQRPCERQYTGPRDGAIGRLEADYAAIGGRTNHRSLRLRAERQRHDTRADGCRRAARRSAWRVRAVPRAGVRRPRGRTPPLPAPAEPLDDPPGVYALFHGLTVGPG